MMKKFIILQLLVVACFIVCNAQSVSDLKNDPAYIWGEGKGSTLRIADRDALEQILQQISMNISHDSKMTISNEQDGSESAKTNIEFKSVMNTYSTATLNNTHRMVVENGPDRYVVVRYVKKSDVDRIFNARKDKVNEYVQIAHQALKQKQINDALRYYYWAGVLTQSLRYPNELEIFDESGEKHFANVWIPARINEIFGNLSVKVLSTDDNEFEMGFFYYNKPVASLDFTYFDGKDWSPVTTAIDGKGLIEMQPAYIPDYFQIMFEYQYYGEAQCDNEVKIVLESMSDHLPVYPKAMMKMSSKDQINKKSAEYADLTTMETSAPNLGTESKATTTAMCDKVMLKVIAAIRNKNYEIIKDCFTTEGYDVFNRLINYGNGRIIGEPKLSYTTLYEDTYCRSVPMNFTFSNNRKFVEDVVFVFDKNGLIDNISFSLGKVATNDIIGNAAQWSVEAKNVLINFLETYKTAYALKRIDYLNSIFADDALIITGKVVTKSMRQLDGTYSNNKQIKLNKQTKDQYIKNLRNMFRSREYVNIKFANNNILKMGKGGEVYSIQIKQDFFSSSYGDSGYLFILVDLNKPNEPTIRVRAWQETPDPEWGKYGPEMF